MGSMAIWLLFALCGLIWLAGVFYVVRGWPKKAEGGRSKVEGAEVEAKAFPSTLDPRPSTSNETREIEIPILEYPHPQPSPAEMFDKDAFYREFGRPNIVEFPAEYIDEKKIRSVTGEAMGILEFAKGCYRQIGFRCAESIVPTEGEQGIYRVSIFDLAFDHYSGTDERFISLFGRLKDKFAQEIESIKNHPDITPAAKKTLVGVYEPLPPLVTWNEKELFLVAVKSAYKDLAKGQMEFLKEFAVEKRLFKAKIFSITQRQKR